MLIVSLYMFSVCVFAIACAFVCVFGPSVVCYVLSVLWAMLPEITFIHSIYNAPLPI